MSININSLNLETDRLLLRNLKQIDAEAIFAYRSDPKIYLYQIWKPTRIEEVTDFINSNIHSETDPSINWVNLAVVLKKEDKLIGDIGLFFFDRERSQLEIGYTISPIYQGNGYAIESVKSVLKYSFNYLNIHRIIVSMDPRNIRSINLVNKIGMRLEANHIKNMKIENEWVDTSIYALLREEYI